MYIDPVLWIYLNSTKKLTQFSQLHSILSAHYDLTISLFLKFYIFNFYYE